MLTLTLTYPPLLNFAAFFHTILRQRSTDEILVVETLYSHIVMFSLTRSFSVYFTIEEFSSR